MDYEKKYEKLVDAVKVLRDNNPSDEGIQNWVNDNVPELIQNEDERIRKALLSGLIDCRDAPDLGWSNFGGIPIDDCITWFEKQNKDGKKWIYEDVYLKEKEQLYQDGVDDVLENPHKYGLEKQGEQEEPQVYETEDGEVITYSESEGYKVVEPKFKVGNWYQCTKDFFGKGVTFDKNTAYYCAKEGCLQNEYGCHIAIVKDLYDNFKLWTIQDAKDGDVLVTVDNERPFIYKGCLDHNHPDSPVAYCGIDCEGCFCRGGDKFNHWWTEDKVQPATKEQRDLLFQKMKEAGYGWNGDKKELKDETKFNVGDCIYEWDDEKKELKKIHVIDEGKAEMDYCFTKMMNGEKINHAWSEEDEKALCDALWAMKIAAKIAKDENDMGNIWYAENWLKSLKDRVQSQWKPSEEQIQALAEALSLAMNCGEEGAFDLRTLHEQLKKLKEK